MFSLLLVDSLIGLVYCAEGTRHLFKVFFGHVLLNHYFLGFWKGLCGWLGFFFIIIQAAVFPSHMSLLSVINKGTSS